MKLYLIYCNLVAYNILIHISITLLSCTHFCYYRYICECNFNFSKVSHTLESHCIIIMELYLTYCNLVDHKLLTRILIILLSYTHLGNSRCVHECNFKCSNVRHAEMCETLNVCNVYYVTPFFNINHGSQHCIT